MENRNLVILEGKCGNLERVTKKNMMDTKERVMHIIPKKLSNTDNIYFKSLGCST